MTISQKSESDGTDGTKQLKALGGKITYDLAIGIAGSVCFAVLVGSASYFIHFLQLGVVQYILNAVLLILCIVLFWLWRHRQATSRSGSVIDSGAYDVKVQPFSSLSDTVDEILESQDLATEDTASTYLLHWVPSFALSRGLDHESQAVRPQQSHVYQALRASLERTHGKVVCFDGLGIYHFLTDSELLFGNPKLTASYLDEVVNMLDDERISVAFLPWGLFPYTLIAIGMTYAVFDFTTIKDLSESEGFVRASNRPTLRLETSSREEVARIRANMFLTVYERANGDPELRQTSVAFLKKMSDLLRTTERIIPLAEAKHRLWTYKTYSPGN